MALNRYYEDELSYLRELGREFAQANPKLAPFLGQDATDPDVERLLEGFAFLVARLRQKLDDEFPEFVHGLLRMVWPQYLQPVPPITTLAFDIAEQASAAALNVAAGTSVRSRPIDGTSCTFVTCYPVDVLPLKIEGVQLENRSGSSRLTLRLKATGKQTLACLQKAPLRLFFATEREPQVGRALLAWMMRHLTQATIAVAGRQVDAITAAQIASRGWAEDDAVLRWPRNSFAGFRIIQEYLLYPEKFLYVELPPIDGLANAQGQTGTLTFDFSRPFDDQIRVVDGQIRLNCTPAINVFSHEAAPVRIDRSKTEYRVTPSGGANYSVHSVDRVVGYLQGRPERIEYAAFESLQHDLPGSDTSQAYFRSEIRPAVVGRGVDYYISFVDRANRQKYPAIEVASLNLTCSNGPIADRLPAGAVDQPTSATPRSVVFSNITSVTSELPPPINDGMLRRLTANLARNYGSLADVETLRTIISTYDFRAVHDAQARRRLELMLEGLDRFTIRDSDTVVLGAPIRMRNIELGVADSKLGSEGELFLFGAVLDAFFSTYAGINMLHRFSIRGTETNIQYAWPARKGTITPF